MKFGNQNKSNMSIMNVLIGIDDLDWKVEISEIIDSGKFGPNTEICPDFYEIWHSQQMEHAYYEYNTRQCLKHSHGYRLRMIVGSEHGTIIRIIIVPVVPCSEWL